MGFGDGVKELKSASDYREDPEMLLILQAPSAPFGVFLGFVLFKMLYLTQFLL